jgi:hypothetical protein
MTEARRAADVSEGQAMNRSTSHAVAFGLGFLTGALLLTMLLGLQVRVAYARAEHFRTEAEQLRSEIQALRKVEYVARINAAEQLLRQAGQARDRAADKKD